MLKLIQEFVQIFALLKLRNSELNILSFEVVVWLGL